MKPSPDRPELLPELVEVAPGVHAYIQPDGSWMINNTGIVVGSDDTLLLVDTTSTEARNRALLASVASVCPAAPSYVINTHHHGDHTFGNWLMPPSTVIVGHEACREEVLAAGLLAAQVLTGPDYGHIEVRPPSLTYSTSLTLYLGTRVVELHHPGPAHTRGDTIAWLPAERVLFTGDLVFAGGQPFLAEGSIHGYLSALEFLRAFNADVVVPGHGPLLRGPEIARVLDDLVAYTTYLSELATSGHASGKTPMEAVREAGESRFSSWQESERLVGNLHRAYHEIDGKPLSERLELPRVWMDMMELHGGPIACHA
ncbi:cyclase [Lentzea albidocapillata subsp. violacea]|uniref:Cyclase n=1 Tax=Lentzea albidocapillata subsp. violacea TaxID=128104 RepID=A0A1G9BSK2_9PSEU|nr:MBL fold metallo-hydrolase [Lentzea albidocapillata]SDK42432.1 cyclase [Lentzea albidocapillata subsp. violacea]